MYYSYRRNAQFGRLGLTWKQTLKEVVRAGLSRLGVYDPIRKALGKSLDHLDRPSLQERFSRIYEKGHWTRGDKNHPLSGSGSSLKATQDLRSELPGLLRSLETGTLLDIGCGDFTWMQQVDLTGIRYIGADIVPSVVETNRARFGADDITFLHADAVSDPLPEADVVLIRETLFHLCFEDVRALLNNVLSSPRRWILMTSDSLSDFNADIRSGDFRLLNLQAAPFRLPAPSHRIDESSVRPGRHLGAWPAESVAAALKAKATA